MFHSALQRAKQPRRLLTSFNKSTRSISSQCQACTVCCTSSPRLKPTLWASYASAPYQKGSLIHLVKCTVWVMSRSSIDQFQQKWSRADLTYCANCRHCNVKSTIRISIPERSAQRLGPPAPYFPAALLRLAHRPANAVKLKQKSAAYLSRYIARHRVGKCSLHG